MSLIALCLQSTLWIALIGAFRQRVAAKVRFRKLVGRNDKGVKANGERLEEELSEVRMEVAK
jgi:hypothetical protein